MTIYYPMLASPGGDVRSLANNDKWWASIKMDGHRLLTIVDDGSLRFQSRTGKPLRVDPALATELQVLAKLPGTWVFDGEYMPKTGHYFLFDLPVAADDLVQTATPYEKRQQHLDVVVGTLASHLIHTLPVWRTTEEKSAAVDRIRDRGGEGLVFKKASSTYRWGRRSKDWMKVKFVKDVDCVIVDRNRDGKTNWVLAVNDGKTWHEVGEVSGLTGDANSINIGSVVTVQCLYASDDNRLVQPVTPRIRHDKDALECTLDQLESIRPNRDILSLID